MGWRRTVAPMCLVLSIVLLASVLCSGGHGGDIIPTVHASPIGGTTLYVGGSTPGSYPTIQSAVDAANPGDTVFVSRGTYYETVRVNTPLHVVGEDRDSTCIEGGEGFAVVSITSPNVSVSGFTIRTSGVNGDGGGDGGGIYLNSSSNSTIKGNSISDTGWGIYLYGSSGVTIGGNTIRQTSDCAIRLESSRGNVITGNILESAYRGISLSVSSMNTLSGNIIRNVSSGIVLASSSSTNTLKGNSVTNVSSGIVVATPSSIRSSSSNNTFTGNSITHVGYDGISLSLSSGNTLVGNTIMDSAYRGMFLSYSPNNTLRGNTIMNSTEYGVWLYYADHNTFTGNTLRGTGQCILVDVSHGNLFTGNIIRDNNVGILLGSSEGSDPGSSGNILYHNSFINNMLQAYGMDYVNQWDNGYPSGGNYWDTYTGSDSDGDHIGDIPYSIGVNNSDRYPLMMPPPSDGDGDGDGGGGGIPGFGMVGVVVAVIGLLMVLGGRRRG